MRNKKILRYLANIVFFFCPVTAIAILGYFALAEVWPVEQRALAGNYVYRYPMTTIPRDEIVLKENGTYQRKLSPEGHNELVITGKWHLISIGWKAIRGRDIRLESPTQFKSNKAEPIQFRDAYLMPQQFAVLSHWGQVQGLNSVKDLRWVKMPY